MKNQEPESLSVHVGEDTVTALLHRASKIRKKITIILGHGAGANQLSKFMQLFAKELAARGFDTVTFNFVYSEKGRSAPDQKAKLEACYRAVINTVRSNRKLKGNRLVIGGKSMGGRIASQVAAEGVDDLAGLVFLGYPLHPPGHPEKLRAEHLPAIKAPMLIIQGERDVFGSPEELRAVMKRFRFKATLNVIERGDHSLIVSRNAEKQVQVYETILNDIADWLKANVPS